jgi:hypothetical protein
MKDNKLLKRLAAIGLLNAADYILTFYALKRGHEELNPVMAHIVHTPLFPILKLAIVPLLLAVIWNIRKKVKPKTLEYTTGLLLITYAILILYFGIAYTTGAL